MIRLHPIYSSLTIHKNLPFDGLLDAQLQVILLYSHEHERNHTATKCVGCQFNKIINSFARHVHHWRKKIRRGHLGYQ